MIAPGIKHTYNFDIVNKSDDTIKYYISFIEKNPKKVNMKYKLKNENKYLFNSENQWIYINKEKTDSHIIPPKGTDHYTLYWYWEDTDRDTEIGKDKNATYSVNIRINSELVEE